MKVGELQEQLGKLDPELDVYCYSEDEAFLAGKRGFVLFDVLDVTTPQAERLRHDDDTPYLRFEKTEKSEVIAILGVTSEF